MLQGDAFAWLNSAESYVLNVNENPAAAADRSGDLDVNTFNDELATLTVDELEAKMEQVQVRGVGVLG